MAAFTESKLVCRATLVMGGHDARDVVGFVVDHRQFVADRRGGLFQALHVGLHFLQPLATGRGQRSVCTASSWTSCTV